jgi:hypothetical protein
MFVPGPGKGARTGQHFPQHVQLMIAESRTQREAECLMQRSRLFSG